MSDELEGLVTRIRQGDADALARFVEVRRPHLLGYIERQLGAGLRRKLEPEDVFQEAISEAVRGLPAMDLSERDPFSWLCQIAERRIIDSHRRFFGTQKRAAGREVALSTPLSADASLAVIDLLVASMTTASQAMARNERQLRLLEALAKLPEEQQLALRLRYVEGLPSKEIAERLGKSDGAVRVMLTRSLGRLQELLGPDAAP